MGCPEEYNLYCCDLAHQISNVKRLLQDRLGGIILIGRKGKHLVRRFGVNNKQSKQKPHFSGEGFDAKLSASRIQLASAFTTHLPLSLGTIALRLHAGRGFWHLYIFSASYHEISKNRLKSYTDTIAVMESDSSLTDLSSELSSARSSMSPPPECHHPFSYPSPQSSQDHSACASSSEQPSKKRSRDPEDLGPPKKRKTTEAKPRTTVHLDLRSPPKHPEFDQTAPLNLLLKTLRKRRKIVVIAGAGISTSAGGAC